MIYIHRGAAIWLLNVFIRKLVLAVLNTWQPWSKMQKKWRPPEKFYSANVSTSCQKILTAHVCCDKNFADVNDEINMFTEQPNKIPLLYAKKEILNVLWYGDVYKEHGLIEVFINEIDKLIRQSMISYWNLRQLGSLYDTPFRATSVLKLKCG